MASQERHGIITGAASGIGRALAVRIAREGWRLALVDINGLGLTETKSLVENAGGAAECFVQDVGDRAAWRTLHTELAQRWPKLDLLVNNAGIAAAGEAELFTDDDWQAVFQTNWWGVVYGCHELIPWLKRNPAGGNILNTASLASFTAVPTCAAYCSSKAAVLSFSEALYGELKPHKIGVTCFCPGFVPTNLLKGGRFQNEQLRRDGEYWMTWTNLTSEYVAEAAWRGVRKRKLYVISGPRARICVRAKRYFPRFFHWMLAFFYGRHVAAAQEAAAAVPVEPMPSPAVPEA
ncbi:MAG: SDR family NAD(P)-dependent oxidoreductase [Pirellulales bacterium]|nr:SDR family NAD(P)-dependent oxidoreductase [Pirellulales bacterium]